MKERLGLNDTIQSAIVKMSEGLPGAVQVLIELVNKTPEIDPDAGLGPAAHILFLDSFGIYGSRIWDLYNHVCGCSIGGLITVLRAVQLGKLDESKLNLAIDNRGGLDVVGLLKEVRNTLPDFYKVP